MLHTNIFVFMPKTFFLSLRFSTIFKTLRGFFWHCLSDQAVIWKYDSYDV